MIDNDLGVSVLESDGMAKKKAVDPKKKPKQRILLVLKADETTAEEYGQWLQEFADNLRAPVTVMVEMAINAFAAQHKFKAPPKRLKR